jgi:hypothetical protein
VLGCLGIPSLLVADSDSHRRLDPGVVATAQQAEKQRKAIESNHRLLKSVGLDPQDWPNQGFHGDALLILDPNLEAMLEGDWPAWAEAQRALIDEEVGHAGKHALTYFRAADEAADTAPLVLINALRKAAEIVG